MLKLEKLMQYCIDKYYECPKKCMKNEMSYGVYVDAEIKYKSVFTRLNNLRRK